MSRNALSALRLFRTRTSKPSTSTNPLHFNTPLPTTTLSRHHRINSSSPHSTPSHHPASPERHTVEANRHSSPIQAITDLREDQKRDQEPATQKIEEVGERMSDAKRDLYVLITSVCVVGYLIVYTITAANLIISATTPANGEEKVSSAVASKREIGEEMWGLFRVME
ncbi:hypothetical protein BU16DRAFT_535746 [Lophium mytilinum]|uniref:Uncharacterized protein n=1 Tax=Lophium mytilinum TaxID=390894 RepID=A0A6A6R3T8_9PEZI|nr:hypothetical protein BU16DRAFT_535746 [Lophium mytilinum]